MAPDEGISSGAFGRDGPDARKRWPQVRAPAGIAGGAGKPRRRIQPLRSSKAAPCDLTERRDG